MTASIFFRDRAEAPYSTVVERWWEFATFLIAETQNLNFANAHQPDCGRTGKKGTRQSFRMPARSISTRQRLLYYQVSPSARTGQFDRSSGRI